MDRYKEGYIDAMANLIDCFVRLQGESKRMPPEKRVKHLLKWRTEIAGLSWLKELRPNYYKQIMEKEEGPWIKGYFDGDLE